MNSQGKVVQGKNAKSADLVAHLTRQTSLGGQSLQLIRAIDKSVEQGFSIEDAIKSQKGEKPAKDPKRLQFTLSTYKRLLTSHLATTGANLKGFASIVSINTAADMFTSAIELTQGTAYKLIGNTDAAEKYFNRAYGSSGGAIRRMLDVLSPDIPIEYADKVLDINPKIAEKLFRDVSGDGGVRDALSDFDIDPNNVIYKGADSVTKGVQTIALVRLQDELTKRWSFGTSLNQEIMRAYGISPEKFFAQENVALIMAKEEFKEVLEKAAYRATRETASVNWSTLPGKSALRSAARSIDSQIEVWLVLLFHLVVF